MKNVPVNELDELQRGIQANNARINEIFRFIGKMYYEQAKDSPSADFEPHFKVIKDVMDRNKQLEARIKFINGIVVCSECGMDNGVKLSFCAGCGTRLPHTFVGDTSNKCERCGNELNPGQKFCGVCGAPAPEKAPAPAPAPAPEATPAPETTPVSVPETTPAPAPVPAPVSKRFCPNCGMEATESDSMFCSGCGCKLD